MDVPEPSTVTLSEVQDMVKALERIITRSRADRRCFFTGGLWPLAFAASAATA